MKAEELKKKDKKELAKMAQDSKIKLSELRFKFASNKLKNVKEVANLKKDIARILTVLRDAK